MRFPDAVILIFCKAPISGRVKTRLAETVGDEVATRVHEQLAVRMIECAISAELAPVQLWTDPLDHPFFERFPLPRFEQRGADLGERMHHALATALTSDQVSRALLVGTDCPPIDADYLQAALTALDGGDAVIGPAEDGGYGLIGLRSVDSILFTDIPWSTDQVAEMTLARLSQAGMKFEVLPTIWDVDTEADLRRWQATE